MKLKKILIVCWGNIFRSPVAKIFMDREIQKKGMGNIIKCDCAGVMGSKNIPMPKFLNFTFYKIEFESAKPVLEKFNLDLSNFKSKPVNEELLLKSDIVLAMDNKVFDFLNKKFPEHKAKIFLFSEFFGQSKEIEDPDGVTIEKKYATITKDIFNCVTEGFNKLLK